MLPFLLLTTRPEESEAAEEVGCFLRATGLRPDDIVHRRLDLDPHSPIDLGLYSGVFLGGSPFNYTTPPQERSHVQLAVESALARLVPTIADLDFPFFGACYGIGALTANLGGVIGTFHGETSGVVDVALTPEGRTDLLLAGIPERFPVIVGHKEAGERLPPGATLLVAGDTCPVQMFRVGDNVYATQFHPELDHASFAARMTTYRDHGYFRPEDHGRILAEASTHDLSVAPGILRAFVDRYAR